MTKYIDSERLKVRLCKSIELLRTGEPTNEITRIVAERHIETYEKLLDFIESIEQKQPSLPSSLDEPAEKQTLFRWHPATESPGKRRVLMAFTRKDLKKGQYVFAPVRIFSESAIPAECVFEEDDVKQLPVAWAYYNEAVKGITEKMCRDAAAYAWGWWPDNVTK